MNLNEYDISNTYTATVTKNERITPADAHDEVRHIVINIADPSFIYVEGQSVGVVVPGPHEFGNPHHLRLYSIASTRQGEDSNLAEFSICVRRCFYIDEISGERYKGIASNYLCDAKPGQAITIAGPYGRQFVVPRDNNANLLMVGVGTGIAPFRAFIKHVFEERRQWKGKVRLFYGARTGMELLYMNDLKDDIGQYYAQDTFEAFEALSPRPAMDAPVALDRKLEDKAEEIWQLIQNTKTYVYVAGLTTISQSLDKAMSNIAGSREAYEEKKKELVDQGRWAELLYD
jgi:ferredoxin--NADP+ reductase